MLKAKMRSISVLLLAWCAEMAQTSTGLSPEENFSLGSHVDTQGSIGETKRALGTLGDYLRREALSRRLQAEPATSLGEVAQDPTSAHVNRSANSLAESKSPADDGPSLLKPIIGIKAVEETIERSHDHGAVLEASVQALVNKIAGPHNGTVTDEQLSIINELKNITLALASLKSSLNKTSAAVGTATVSAKEAEEELSVLTIERESEEIIDRIQRGVYTIDYATGRLQDRKGRDVQLPSGLFDKLSKHAAKRAAAESLKPEPVTMESALESFRAPAPSTIQHLNRTAGQDNSLNYSTAASLSPPPAAVTGAENATVVPPPPDEGPIAADPSEDSFYHANDKVDPHLKHDNDDLFGAVPGKIEKALAPLKGAIEEAGGAFIKSIDSQINPIKKTRSPTLSPAPAPTAHTHQHGRGRCVSKTRKCAVKDSTVTSACWDTSSCEFWTERSLLHPHSSHLGNAKPPDSTLDKAYLSIPPLLLPVSTSPPPPSPPAPRPEESPPPPPLSAPPLSPETPNQHQEEVIFHSAVIAAAQSAQESNLDQISGANSMLRNRDDDDLDDGSESEEDRERVARLAKLASRLRSATDRADPSQMKTDFGMLHDIAVTFLATALGGLIAAVLGVPVRLGYIFGGILIGPSSPLIYFGLVHVESEYQSVLSRVDVVHTVALLGPCFSLFRYGMNYGQAGTSPQEPRGRQWWWIVYFVSVFGASALFSSAMNWTESALEAALFAAGVTLSETPRVRGALDQVQIRQLAVGHALLGLMAAQDLFLAPLLSIPSALHHSWLATGGGGDWFSRFAVCTAAIYASRRVIPYVLGRIFLVGVAPAGVVTPPGSPPTRQRIKRSVALPSQDGGGQGFASSGDEEEGGKDAEAGKDGLQQALLTSPLAGYHQGGGGCGSNARPLVGREGFAEPQGSTVASSGGGRAPAELLTLLTLVVVGFCLSFALLSEYLSLSYSSGALVAGLLWQVRFRAHGAQLVGLVGRCREGFRGLGSAGRFLSLCACLSPCSCYPSTPLPGKLARGPRPALAGHCRGCGGHAGVSLWGRLPRLARHDGLARLSLAALGHGDHLRCYLLFGQDGRRLGRHAPLLWLSLAR